MSPLSHRDRRPCRDGEEDDGYQRRHRISRSAERSSRGTRRVLPTLKLGTFNGSSCLRTFLSKFENCLDYYEWSDRERLCHLRAGLEGPAGQVLWDAGRCTSSDDLIQLLKNRFGSLNEEERYRSELKARRRRRGEPLQSVYQDVRRLMTLAFPGHSGTMWEIMARDAFVESGRPCSSSADFGEGPVYAGGSAEGGLAVGSVGIWRNTE